MPGPWEKYAKIAQDFMEAQRASRDQALTNVRSQYADLVRNPSLSKVSAPLNDDEHLVADSSLAIAMGDAGVGGKTTKLAMDEASRLARAKEMGFDTKKTYYHGTKHGDIEQFNPNARTTSGLGDASRGATFFSENPRIANNFSGGSKATAPTVIPTHLSVKNPFDYENSEHVAALLDLIPKSERAQIINGTGFRKLEHAIKEGNWSLIENPKVFSAIQKLGHDAAYVAEYGEKNMAVFDPSKIRSKFAAFDPSKAKSGNISAGIAAAALGAGAAASKDEAEGPWNKYQINDWGTH